MPADLELGAAITVEDTSELDGLTADVAPQGGDGGGATGGAMGGGGGIMDMLGNMKGLLKIATVALGVLMAVPGLLSGVMRLLEVALLPIGILFQSLLAPLIQRLLKWLVQNDIIGMVQRFAQKIVTAITNFIAGLQPLIDSLQEVASFFTAGEDREEKARETQRERGLRYAGGANLPPGRAFNAEGEVVGRMPQNPGEDTNFIDAMINLLNPESELTSTSRDTMIGESGNGQTQEDGP